jgi:aspartyl-tRNA(Asn)/glutamyl-tRNA(Gln) amidotransferase subunit B
MKDEELKKMCQDVLSSFPNRVNEYKLGKTGLLGMFADEVMNCSRGLADPKKITDFLKQLLNEK